MQAKLVQKLIDCGLAEPAARQLALKIISYASKTPEQTWERILKEILTAAKPADYPFALHHFLYQFIYPDWDKTPRPAWFPDLSSIETSNLAKLLHRKGFKDYTALQQWSCEDRAEFWQIMVSLLGIQFDRPYTTILDLDQGPEFPRWFVGGSLNIINSCFRAENKDQVAIVTQNHQGELIKVTYDELDKQSSRIASCIARHFQKGDSLALIMPMTVEAVQLYLAVIKAGCVCVAIADSFSDTELGIRLSIAKVKGIFTQSQVQREGKIFPLYEKVQQASAVFTIVMPLEPNQSCDVPLRKSDCEWISFLEGRSPAQTLKPILGSNANEEECPFKAVCCDPSDPVQILFSSGTTGEPKAIPWDHSTPIKCASDAWLHHNVQPGDLLCWPTSLGWMMGPWLIFAALLNQASLALYPGNPNQRGFGEFLQNSGVTLLGVVPTLVKHWRETGCMEQLDWQSIKAFSSTGECSNVEDMLYLMWLAGYRPIIEYCGGTEIGGGYITGTVIQPSAPAAFTTPALGLDFTILDEGGHATDLGEVALIPPSMGLSTRLANQDHHQVYYANFPSLPDGRLLRRHGDQIKRYENGYYRLFGRTDDTMNLSGIKLSSVEIERVLNTHPQVHETAAVAIAPKGGGPEELIVFLVLAGEAATLDLTLLTRELQQKIKTQLNPLFKIHAIQVLEQLPRTASNKILRRKLRQQYEAGAFDNHRLG